jgi:hypothetical protein
MMWPMNNVRLSSKTSPTPCFILCSGFALWSTVAIAQRLQVKVIDRQESETEYTYQPAVHSTSTSRIDGNRSDSAGTTTTAGPTKFSSFQVSGATLSLQLPDGRVAVVNCNSKLQPHLAGQPARRSCRMPAIDVIEADFKGSTAKLSWPISVDGKKVESETYRILGVVPKPVESLQK